MLGEPVRAVAQKKAPAQPPLRTRTPEREFAGVCKVAWANGDFYDGGWMDGRRNGFGEQTWVKRSATNTLYVEKSYRGQWKDDQFFGLGSLYYRDMGFSSAYKGEFISNKKTGYGEETQSCGKIYKGSWDDDLPDGYGIATNVEGGCVKGYWVRGVLFKEDKDPLTAQSADKNRGLGTMLRRQMDLTYFFDTGPTVGLGY